MEQHLIRVSSPGILAIKRLSSDLFWGCGNIVALRETITLDAILDRNK